MILTIALVLGLLLVNVNSSFLQPLKAPENIEELNRFVSYFLNPRDIVALNGSQEQLAVYLNNLTTGGIKRDEYDTWDAETRAKYMDTLHKSRTVSGRSDSLYFGRFIERLSTGKCTKTLVLGGSLTCGHKLQTDKEMAFPQLLEELLNQVFPCFEDFAGEMDIDVDAWNTTFHKLERHHFSNSKVNQQARHKVVNRCVSATGSAYASMNFESLSSSRPFDAHCCWPSFT
jgi:hypothetical protein